MEMIISDETPAGSAVLAVWFGALRWSAHLARPRWQPGYACGVAVADLVRGGVLLSHERRRIGSALLEVALLEVAAPLEQYDALIGAAVMRAAEAGFAWVQIHAQPALLAPYGFTPVTCAAQLTLPAQAQSLPLRTATAADLPDLAALSMAWMGALPLSIERGLPEWRWLITHAAERVALLEDRHGRVVGYGVRDGFGVVREAVAAEAGLGARLLGALAAHWHAPIALGPAHPLVRDVVVAGGSVQVQRHPANAFTALWGVLDLRAALQELSPLLRQRLAASPYHDWRGSITFVAEASMVAVQINALEWQITRSAYPRGDLVVWQISLRGMAQLCLGFQSAASLRAQGELDCADHELGVLDVLFPVLPIT